MRRFSITLAITILLLVSVSSAQQTPTTAVPNLILYSGTLKDALGTALSQDAIPIRAEGQTRLAINQSTVDDQTARYNLAPRSRTLRPVSIFAIGGNVQFLRNIRLIGSHSFITLDFGKEVGGIVTLSFAGASDANQAVGLAFTESSLFAGWDSDASNGTGPDGAIYAPAGGATTYTMPPDKVRGGFRYLTIFLATRGWVDLRDATLRFTASPGMADLRAYPNYFLSNDDLLNRIWYAGAYTVQLNTIDPAQGKHWPQPPTGWENNGVVGSGESVLVDGAKRDRTVWPGDLAISQATAFVSTGDTISTRNSLSVLYEHQQSDGGLPYCGPEINYGTISDTYHLWTLMATAEYFLSSGDNAWLTQHWLQYQAGVSYSTNKIDHNGLFNADRGEDWGRDGYSRAAFGEELEANALLYRVLVTGAYLAGVEGDLAAASTYAGMALSLKSAVNARLWDAAAQQYMDKPGSSLHPQDGNSLALWFGLVDTAPKAASVSQALRQNWNQLGARTPEKTNAIATFPGSMEVHAHFAVGDDQAALDLIRLEWGYMLNNPRSTKSTFWEGYKIDGSFWTWNRVSIPFSQRGEYMSHAHGWATGPSSALTFYVLGVAPEGSSGMTYHVIPHPGDLTHAEGRLILPSGPLSASWTREPASGTFTEYVQSPPNAYGRVGVPTFGRDMTVYVDGRLVWNSCTSVSYSTARDGVRSTGVPDTYFYLDGMSGSHTITAAAIDCSEVVGSRGNRSGD
jgi:hypothetical protein